jgi:ribosomal protein S18 acetylase RimI-like enzyme
MVASTARRNIPFSGLRPLNVSRDLKAVADLIAEAFADDMDPSGERSVREMRAAGRWAFLFGWMDRLAPPGEGMAPGFVWVEDNRIVGTLSVRRTALPAGGRGWLIGNVAVSPGWRRRGIARALMSAAIDLARRRRGEWVALQVRSDNMGARALYESLGFVNIGESIQYRRARPVPITAPGPAAGDPLRMARPADIDRIYSLAQTAIPEELRWAEPLRRDDFWMGFDRGLNNWLTGRREAWWVIETTHGIIGAAHAEANRPPNDGRLRVWVAPAWQGEHEDRLVRTALASLGDASNRPMMAAAPAAHTATRQALESAGFEVLRGLTHMRLNLR